MIFQPIDKLGQLCNDRLCEIVGYPKSELLTKTFQDITHPDDLKTDLHAMHELIDGKISTYSMEKRYYRKDKSIVWVNFTVSLMKDDKGASKYFISVIQDISDHKKVEEAVQQSEEQLRILANSMLVFQLPTMVSSI